MTRILTEEERIALNALVDGELGVPDAMAWSAKVAADPELAAARDEIEATREVVGALDRPTVSAEFLRRIEALPPPAGFAPLPPLGHWAAGWRSIAAAVVITTLIASSATYYLAAPRSASFEVLVADAHRRSLLASSPVDVLSSDRHTVKPWLDARLGVSPPAPDLAAQGYTLVGGRVEVLAQQPLPTLVYRHNEHTISVVAQPRSATTSSPIAISSGGYNIVEWAGSGFGFTAVSDLETSELTAFAAAYRGAAGSQ